MHVGCVWVRVMQPTVAMAVGVRLAWRIIRTVFVLMVLVVHVLVLVHHRLVQMLMIVVFGHVQPDADRHQDAGSRKLDRQRFAEQDYGCYRAEKRSGREVGSRTRCAEVSKRSNE